MSASGGIRRGSLKQLNEREEKFLDNFFNPKFDGDLVLAYISAGYSDGPKAGSNARAKLAEVSEHVKMRAFNRFDTHIPWAINELVILIKNTKSDMVKLKGIQDILGRAGLDQPLVIDNSQDGDARALTSKEIAGEVAKLLEKAGARPELKVVGGTDGDK